MLAIIQNFIEMLFSYKESVYYRLHFASIIIVGFLLGYVIYQEYKLKNVEEERPISKCSDKQSYFDFVTHKQKNTREAVEKLENSKQYQQYLKERDNPNSRYNRRVITEDVSDIQLSDDSDRQMKKKR